MAEQIVWLDGIANVGKERICPGRHVRQNQWQSAWNEEYVKFYDYISDYECIFNHPINDSGNDDLDQEHWQKLQAAKEQGTSVPITKLAHFTKPAAAQQIVDTQGFKGRQKKINDVEAKFSWWSPVFKQKQKTNVRVHLGKVIQPFLNEQDNPNTLQNQFAQSDAFRPNPRRYGDRLFQYRIDKLCKYYADQQVDGEVQYKILGTFCYKTEIMHAVLVCSQANGVGQFRKYPTVLRPDKDVNNEAVITRDDDGNWVWKPQATATEITRLEAHPQVYHKFRRWEHVAFAFHIPDNEDMIMAGNPADHHKIINDQGNIEDFRLKKTIKGGGKLLPDDHQQAGGEQEYKGGAESKMKKKRT